MELNEPISGKLLLAQADSVMNTEQFDQTLRQFKHREPFEPFVVELLDGRMIEIVRPNFVFCEGFASFFTPDFDLVDFACEEVREIRPAVHGVAS
jgi:hypothetical protein